jgi:diguanylate cyclase (GGDEF)-like protein
MVAKGNRQGIIVLVDERPSPQISVAIPLLELLASIATAALEAVGASAALAESQQLLAFQASHDLLTGVANRTRLLEALAAELPAAVSGLAPVVLFVDLDGFKEVNDAFGHGTGDKLLAAVAERLSSAARSADLVARLGGDEFIVVCGQLATLAEATAVAERILERLAQPFHFDGVDASLTACIGIAAAGQHRSPEALIASADRAMYAAKAQGRGCWAVSPD